MAYEANRGMGIEDDKDAQLERDTQNNAKNIRNAADVAIASKNPYAMAAGAGVKIADKISNGKASEKLGEGMAKANQIAPGGRRLQDLSNKMSESGASDKVGRAAAMKNAASGDKDAVAGGNADKELAEKLNNNKQRAENAANNAANQAAQRAQQNAQDKQSGGGQDSSLPSSSGSDANSGGDDDKKDNVGGLGKFIGRQALIVVATTIAPFLILILIIIVIIASVTGMFNDYNDAFGMSYTLGEETGGMEFNATSKEQEAFLDRVNGVKLSYQAQGKTLDAMKIVAIYHSLTANGVDITYDDVTTSVIEKWANAMFSGNSYNEDTFKNNLTNNIFPSYKPGEDKAYYEDMTKEVFDYIDRYYDLIKKNDFGTSCSPSGGNCTYDIKGYYIKSKGNVIENVSINNLYVRLMQCGTADGHNYGGTFGKPVAGEELVPFEKYILGVAYQEIGDDAPEHAFKAQMVASRGYILARHADMGGWRTLKKEGDKWVLQAAACTQDQVYCDPDQGCSSDDGQWKMVFSGTNKAKKLRDPIPQDSKLRRWASEIEGEVLTNSQGYICYSGYKSSEQSTMKSLAQKGLNYKQILLQIYNQGSRNLGATDVKKFSCSNGGTGCISTGDFASWKQGDARWGKTPMGNSGRSLSQIGCLVTSVSMLIAKSGVPVEVSPFDPGTFVQFLNKHGGFASGGNFIWGVATQVAPSFHYQGQISLAGMSREAKLNKIKEITSQKGVYAAVEVKGNTGQHWVAIDGVNGSTINMMDPSSNSTDMWSRYNWVNTSTIAYYRVG